MAQDRTSGFDILIQISESELNTQLETAFLAGIIIPHSMSFPINSSGISGTADINFNTPVADLDRPRPKMGITIPFQNSQLQITSPLPLTVAPLGGNILIVDDIQVITEDSNELIVMDFNSGAPVVTVLFDAASQIILAPLLAAAGLTIAQAQNIFAGQVLSSLQNDIHRFDLSQPIAIVDDTDPATVFDVDITTINDATAADRDCLVIGVRTSSEGGGNINNATSNFIPAGANSMVMMSNFWLLARVMRPRLATAMGIPLSALDTPLRLNTPVPAPGGQGTLTELTAFIEGDHIRINGTATDSGTGWSAVSHFTFNVFLTLSGSSIIVTNSEPVIDTDVDLEWWVWLVSLGLGGLFFGIVGVIVSAIVLAIVESIAEGVANNAISSGISGAIGNIPALPLGPIGTGLGMTSLVLDDLEMHCSILKSLTIPIKSERRYFATGGFAADLDINQITTNATLHSDFSWDPSRGISALNLSGLTVVNSHFHALTPVQVSRLPLNSTSISASGIPYGFANMSWMLPNIECVFGLRTSDGRFGKGRALKALDNSNEFMLEWILWDTAIPQLDIAERMSVVERGDVTNYVNEDCSYCSVSEVRWRGVFEAVPRLMAFPVDYQWCLCGEVLKDKEGVIHTSGGDINYTKNGKWLYIETTTLGQNLNCELCISGIDYRGQELFTCIRVKKSGVDRQCKPCIKGGSKVPITFLPIGAKIEKLKFTDHLK